MVRRDDPHEVGPAIWSGAAPSAIEAIQEFWAAYDRAPSYALIMYAKSAYAGFPADATAVWWSELRKRLAGPEAVASPLEYALWCDFFEDPDTVEDAWRALTLDEPPPEVLRAVLRASGPVPWGLKANLYESLATEPEWRAAVLNALRASAFDVYGQVDPAAAARLLASVESAGEPADVEELRRRLEMLSQV